MKKNTILFSFLAVGLTLCFSSCKDDDELTTEQKEEKAYEELLQQDKSQNVLSQLTNADLGADWQSGTYAPTIGQADNGNEGVRVVSTGDMETAIQRFCDLVGIEADAFNADNDYTWTDERIGSLTWRKGGTTELASVYCEIKQIPSLSKIVYMSPEQIGDNSSFDGTAYYRFGDVVRKKNSDGEWDYWVCVRPAFGPEGKEESHWITLSPLPSKNLNMVSKTYNGVTTRFELPKGLTTKTEHLQNMAEMVYAMTHHLEWATNLQNNGYKTLKYFHDFNYNKNFLYNGDKYFANVDWAWKQSKVDGKDLYKTIFRLSADEFTKSMEDFGMRFVYGDASFSSNATVNFTLQQYEGTNLKTSSKGKYSVYSPGEDYFISQKYTADAKFPDDNKSSIYLPRYATGADLCKGEVKGKYNVYSPLPNCEDVYVYNKLFGILNDKAELKNITPEIPYYKTNGIGFYLPGDVVIDEEGCRWFCLLGSPYGSPVAGMHEDHTAYFFSLEGIKLSADGKTATNIVSEEELPILLFYYSSYFSTLGNSPDIFKYISSIQPGEHNVHINDYAGVDITKLFVRRDSTWSFYDYKTKRIQDSQSTSSFYNVAYNNGNNDKQAIARVWLDFTQGGNKRSLCPDNRYIDIHARAYKHYFNTDRSLDQQPDSLERLLGLTPWHMPWALSNDVIYLQDVADAAKVATYGPNDKWVTQLWHIDGGWEDITGGRGQIRTTVEQSADPADFLWNAAKRDYETKKTHMYNEPVLFIRMMKVWDTGPFPTLQSIDGKVKFSILHHQNSEKGYNLEFCRMWGNPFIVNREVLLQIDNKSVVVPNFIGWIG